MITIKDDKENVKDISINDFLNIYDDNCIFLENKYTKIYWRLIEKAKNRILDDSVKTEKHHVFPKSIFGDNSILVSLTLREHFFAHKLLVKMTTGKNKSKMVIAAFKMAHNMKKFISMPSSKYETLRKEFSSLMSESMKNVKRENKQNKDPEKIRKTAEKHRGMKRSEETRKKQSEKRKLFFSNGGENSLKSTGKGMIYVHHKETGEVKRVEKDFNLGNDWIRGTGIKLSEETRKKISENNGRRKR